MGFLNLLFNQRLISSKIKTFLLMFIVLSSSLRLFWVSRVFSFSDWWCFWLPCLFSQLFSSLVTGAQVRPAVFPLWFQSNSEPPESDKSVMSMLTVSGVSCLWQTVSRSYRLVRVSVIKVEGTIRRSLSDWWLMQAVGKCVHACTYSFAPWCNHLCVCL